MRACKIRLGRRPGRVLCEHRACTRVDDRKVAAHAIGNDGIMAALKADVDTIEHGHGFDEESIDLMVEKDWASRGPTPPVHSQRRLAPTQTHADVRWQIDSRPRRRCAEDPRCGA